MLQNALISLLYDLANRFPLFPPHRNCKIWAEIHLHNVQLDQLEMIVSTHESLLDTPLSVVVVIPSIIILCYVTASSARSALVLAPSICISLFFPRPEWSINS